MPRLQLDRGPRPGDLLEILIEDFDRKGRGRATLHAEVGPQREPKDYEIIVHRGVPGDRVEVRVGRQRKGRVEAKIARMIEPSGMRIEPRCKHFGRRSEEGSDKGCGGCTWQFLDYRHQLAVKERLIKGLLQKAGVDPGLVAPVRAMEEPWFYRNKMEYSFGDDAERNFSLGLHPAGFRYEVLALDECFLESDFVSRFVPRIGEWAASRGLEAFQHEQGFLRQLTIREGKRTDERMVELVTTHGETAMMDGEEVAARQVAEAFRDAALAIAAELGGAIDIVYWTQYRAVRGEPTTMKEHHLCGRELLHEELILPGDHRLRFEIHPRAFFQPNTLGAEILYGLVMERAGLSAADASSTRVLDLYCGTGTIGMCLAPYAESVVGVELQPDAVDNARRNAAHNAIDNIEFYCGDVGEVLEEHGLDGDVVVLDPPRSGLLPGAKEQLEKLSARRLVYVSCNPAALARDLVELQEAGWVVRSVEPVDLFPQTYHVENVVLLER